MVFPNCPPSFFALISITALPSKELNYYPLTLGDDWQVHIVDEGSDTDAFDAWLSLTKMALLPDWSIICVKGVVYELSNSGFLSV